MRPFWEWVSIALLAALAVFLAVPLEMQISVAHLEYASSDTVPKTDVAVVLGASVVRGAPSPVLAARADEAIDLYQKGKVKKILVTGDNGALSHDEVTPVRKYLVAAGIPAGDIFLDHAGFDTYSSMYRAHAIFGATSATIVTQNYHLPRALFIAQHVGLSAVGVSALGGENSLEAFLREIPASWKALFDVLTHREPKYLGDPIPLSGSGEATWY
jgi:SanA protein